MNRALVIGKWALVVVVSFCMGFVFSQFLTDVEKTAIYSNRHVAEKDLKRGIEEYRQANGKYPDSLDAVKISWLGNEGPRRKMLLKPFYYENRGDSYVLWWPRSDL